LDSASATLLEFGRCEWQAQLCLTMVLHPGANLWPRFSRSPIVTGGGLRGDGRGLDVAPLALSGARTLRHVRGKYLAGLRQLHHDGQLAFHGQQMAPRYARRFRHVAPGQHEEAVCCLRQAFRRRPRNRARLSCPLHATASASPNRRILSMDTEAGTVTFDYKDYADARNTNV